MKDVDMVEKLFECRDVWKYQDENKSMHAEERGDRDMQVRKSLVLEEEDRRVAKRVLEMCNMAANFFVEGEDGHGGIRDVKVLMAGHPLEHTHMQRAFDAVWDAKARVEAREPHQMFPEELKKRYLENLEEVLGVLCDWTAVAV